MTTKGAGSPEVEHAYSRARVLCQQVGDTPQLFPVLYGLVFYHLVRAEYQTARELGEQCLRLARNVHDDAFLLQAHFGLWVGLCHLGEWELAHEHLEQGRALYDRQQRRVHTFYGRDPGVACHSFAARVLWFRGYPDQARTRIHEALALARDLAYAYTLAIAQAHAAVAYQFLRDAQAAHEQAEAAITFSTEQGFPMWAAKGTILRGWALTAHGQIKEGLVQLRQGLVDWEAIGSQAEKSYFLTLMAEAYGKVGQADTGLTLLAEALDWVEQTGERFWHAELCRLQGELLLTLSADNHDEATSCFAQALDIARQQDAKSLELRAAMSLGRLWQSQDKRQDAYDLLTPVYEWFTEGFDTADLQEAKVLLNELRG